MSDAHTNLENVEKTENGQTGDGFAAAPAPSQPSQASELSKEHQQVRKWLQDAILASRGDVYSGKRDEARFKKPIQLDAKFFDSGPSDTARATMHNISCTGIGFWVRDEVEVGTIVQLRDCDPLARISWVSATITHCRQGLRGFVVGARFESPLTDPPPGWEELMAVCTVEPAAACESTSQCEPTGSCESPEAAETQPACEPTDEPTALDDRTDDCSDDRSDDRSDGDENGKSDRGILSWFGLG